MSTVPSFLDYSSYFKSNRFRAGISYKKNVNKIGSDRNKLADFLGLKTDFMAFPEQIHSSNVIILSSPGKYAGIDGIVSLNKQIVLSIQTADCVPIFLFDQKTELFALVHAGWKGTALGIIDKTVNIIKDTGAAPEDIQVLLGPSIGQCCFETGPDVWRKYPEKYLLKGINDRYYLDLAGSIMAEFVASGFNPELISNVQKCTSCGTDSYPSYRRDGKKAGRMVAACGWV